MLDQSDRNHQFGSVVFLHLEIMITDGHHRAYQALLAGRDTISAELIRDGGDELYALYAPSLRERK